MDVERAKGPAKGFMGLPVEPCSGKVSTRCWAQAALISVSCASVGAARSTLDHGTQARGQGLDFNVVPGHLSDGFAHGFPSLSSLP